MKIHGQNLFDFLKDRGLLYQSSDMKKIEELLNGEPINFYLGIDPTADAIHIGHLCSLRTFKYLQDAGHHGVLLIGGATAMVGDPSGKQDMRAMLTRESVDHNLEQIKNLCKKFIKTDGENPAVIVNNNDWMKNYAYVDFLRDVGTYFNVNVMLSAEAYKKRLENGGLTFLEMGYMPIQSHDFEHLHNTYGTILQVGGSDQWGNMIAGVELARKKLNKEFCCLTTPLLLNAQGEKMGKTAGGALWATEGKTAVYDFYQYFMNVDDRDVEKLLKWFSDYSNEEIAEIMKGDIRDVKKLMAFEVTALIHGKENATQAQQTAQEVFSGAGQSENMPKVELSASDWGAGLNICELLEKTKICASRSEARRLIEQGGISLDGNKITDFKLIVNPAKELIVKKGKKVFVKIVLI